MSSPPEVILAVPRKVLVKSASHDNIRGSPLSSSDEEVGGGKFWYSQQLFSFAFIFLPFLSSVFIFPAWPFQLSHSCFLSPLFVYIHFTSATPFSAGQAPVSLHFSSKLLFDWLLILTLSGVRLSMSSISLGSPSPSYQ